MKTNNTAQLIALSEERFDKWLAYHNIKLQPHQKRLALDIFQLESLNFKRDLTVFFTSKGLETLNKDVLEQSSFVGLGSGLTFTFQIAERFIKDRGTVTERNFDYMDDDSEK